MLETWEKILDPNFINAELIGPVGSERIVTIKDIEFAEAFDQRTQAKISKQALFFDECLPMILNKTNIKTLISLFGSDSPSACIGKKIIIYVVNCKVAGKATTGIRIKEYSDIKCEGCGESLKPAAGKRIDELIEISKRNCNRILCVECMKKEKAKNG